MDGPQPAAEAAARNMTEAQLQTAVMRLARALGWLTYHTQFSIRSVPGFPDLLMVHPQHGLVALELKTSRGRVGPAQQDWITALGRHIYARVIRPSDLIDGTVEKILRGARP
jgi:hypothetical protein